MNTSVTLHLGPSTKQPGYTIETVAGCKIVHGLIPASDMVGLAAMVPGDAHIDSNLARRLGATLVIGAPEALNELRAKKLPPCPHLQAEARRARAAGASQAACDWLLDGERSTSADSLFSIIVGVSVMREDADFDVPQDPDDLRRCRLLLESTGWDADRLKSIPDVLTGWKGLVEDWNELCALMDNEVPAWRTEGGQAPRTCAKMKSLLTKEKR